MTAGDARPRIVVGLMSGTSLDGISAAVVRFDRASDGHVTYDLLGMSVRPYDAEQRERLGRALVGATPREYCRLSFDLADWLADAAIRAMAEAGVGRADVAAIASHGQTVWHEPGHSTWQFGEPAVIAERTGVSVVSNFRVRDVAAAGQGAPLVPIADALLFSHPTEWRALQNLGGIGNVTVVPPGGIRTSTRAFDTGPGVVVIDGVTRIVAPEMAYDVDGRLARTGHVIDAVVAQVLTDPYFASPPPKSTGRERYGAPATLAWAARHADRAPLDLVATAVAFAARAIADSYRRFVLPRGPVDEVLVSGGGAQNRTLMAELQRLLSPIAVRPFAAQGIDADAKEAVAFALFAVQALHADPASLPSVTGAARAAILGKICLP